jgi:WD repeat-containing protein 23
MDDTGSVSGFESDDADVGRGDWTLNPEQQQQQERQEQQDATADAAPTPLPAPAAEPEAATTATATSDSDTWDSAQDVGTDDEVEDDDDDEEEEDDDDEIPYNLSEAHRAALLAALDAAARGRRGEVPAAADADDASGRPPRPAVQRCAVVPLPAPPKPPHPPLMQALDAAVAATGGAPRGGTAAAAAALDRHGAPLSVCRRRLLRLGLEGGSGGAAGNSSDGESDEDEEEDAMDATPSEPQRRSARLAGRAADASPNGARDQEQQEQRRDPRKQSNATAAAANANDNDSNSTLTVLNTARLLLKRDLGLGAGAGGSLSRAQRLHASALPPQRALPTVPCRVRDQMASRAYVGQFSADGNVFVAAFQDRRVRVYDVGVGGTGGGAGGGGADGGDDNDYDSRIAAHARRGGGGAGRGAPNRSTPPPPLLGRWRLRKDISTRLTRWTVTDTALSADGRYLCYSSITPVVWLVDMGDGSYDRTRVDSRANETQLHDALSFAPRPPEQGTAASQRAASEAAQARSSSFGIWSVAWAPGVAGQLVAGTSERSALVYDLDVGRVVQRLGGHGDDVNAVAHLDPLSPHLVVTGADDGLVRLWDRRANGSGGGGNGGNSGREGTGTGSCSKPVGVWLGHTEGVTHLCPRGDGRLVLSNGKDQTARAFDARSGLRSPQEVCALPPVARASTGYDYRWEAYPYAGHAVLHPSDSAVQVYRGHSVLQSLVRAYFSPEESTGGRYVCAGSADGRAVIWDAATAEVVARLEGAHGAVVRDVAWHPREAALVTASWDGSLVEWRALGSGGGEEGDDEGVGRGGGDG